MRLQSGRLTVVPAQNRNSLLTPKVKAFFSTKSNQRILPEKVELGSPWCRDKIAGLEPVEKWPFADLERLSGLPDDLR